MQVISLIAIGFVLGVVVAMLFGKRIADAAVADVKAVAYDAGRTVTDATTRLRVVMNGIEMRMHNKIDTLKADATGAAKDVEKL